MYDLEGNFKELKRLKVLDDKGMGDERLQGVEVRQAGNIKMKNRMGRVTVKEIYKLTFLYLRFVTSLTLCR